MVPGDGALASLKPSLEGWKPDQEDAGALPEETLKPSLEGWKPEKCEGMA